MNVNLPTDNLGSEVECLTSTVVIFPTFAAQTAAGKGVVDDDGPLVARCQSGDINAFSQLVDRHEHRVRSIVSRILLTSGDQRNAILHVDVEDFSQEVFVQAWKALPRFRGDARFSTWLYRIAVNRALKEYNHLRRGSGKIQGIPVSDDLLKHLAASRPDPNTHLLDPECMLQQRARDEALRLAIDDLPEKQRLVLLLHYFEECSCEEISVIAGCTVGTVWSRLHYACRKLQEKLSWMDPASTV